MKENPILLTGSHRSGTTWVGTMLSASPTVLYIPEVFNRDQSILRNKRCIKYWFHYMNEDNKHEFRDTFTNMLYPDYGWKYFLGLNSFRGLNRKDGIRIRLKSIFKLLKNLQFKIRPLLKDPLALFSSEWIHHEFGSDVIILIRHPCSFVNSQLRLNWRFDFNNFLSQKDLMENFLYPFEKQLCQKINDPIEEAAILWKCIHHVIAIYRDKYQNWIFKRLEDISINPVEEFRNISKCLDIPFTNHMERKIKIYSDIANPIEAPNNTVFALKRNSKLAIKSWKERLSKEQIFRIRKIVDDVASRFYSDEEW